MSNWCILRTPGRSTLRLAEQLRKRGIEAWAPSKTVDRRIPRRRARVSLCLPILPSFVFANAQSAHRLSFLSMQPGQLPSFSVFRHSDKIPIVADAELAKLREFEEREALKVKRKIRHVWEVGQAVRVSEGPAQGMAGTVERSDGGFVLVCFGGRLKMKIASFLLADIGLSDRAQAIAA